MKASLNIALCSLLYSTANAAEVTRPVYTPPASSMLQITLSLLLVLVVILAIGWLLKRMNVAQQGSANLLQVIGSVAIGQRERVILLEVNDTWLLIGVGPGQIRTLHTMEKTAITDLPSRPATDKKFAALLSSLLKSCAGNSNAP